MKVGFFEMPDKTLTSPLSLRLLSSLKRVIMTSALNMSV